MADLTLIQPLLQHPGYSFCHTPALFVACLRNLTDFNELKHAFFSVAAVFQRWLGLGLLQPRGGFLAGQRGFKAVACHWVVPFKLHLRCLMGNTAPRLLEYI